NTTNRILLFDKAQYEYFSPFNKACIFHLPLASAVDRFDKVIQSITDEDRNKFACDISFVGSTYREKDPLSELNGLSDYTKGYIEALSEASLKIYGYYPVKDAVNERILADIKRAAGNDFPYIKDAVRDLDEYTVSHRYIGSHLAVVERELTLNTLSKYFKIDFFTKGDTSHYNAGSGHMLRIHPPVDTLSEMPKIFNLSRINLNMTMRPIETGLPLRCFDILGCGGFLMTNYQQELEDMFTIGEDLEAYSSLEELIDKCDYYLSHEEERRRIAINGYENVIKNHSHFCRLKEMMGLIQ
ncbi:MAG: glycosyltransferase, partial [Lachnospiraceae bacterium]|nr:glycosyltransferase [Lachnospiraceae bacterium]